MERDATHPWAPDPIFRRIPRRAVLIFHAAVFFIFAPVGLLAVSSLRPERAWLPVLINLALSGLIAVTWAATFTVSRRFVAGIVATNAMMIALNTAFRDTPFGLRGAAPSLLGFGLIATIVVGYVLFLLFISGQGRTTLRLMTEMALARGIHETLVPPVRFAGRGIEALGSSTPSTEMGGDLIDVVDRNATTDLFLTDVSGHGVRAGVVLGMVKAAIRMGLRRDASLDRLLGDLNDVLCDTTSDELYATLVALRVGPGGRVEFALAGHHPIVHYRAATGRLERLTLRSFPLGLFHGRTYETGTVHLAPGDLLAVYTDGLNETADAADDELGHEAIEQVVRGCADRPLEEIRQAVFDLAERHGRQTDDRTLLLVGRRHAA